MKRCQLSDLVIPVDTWNPARSGPEESFQYIDLSAIDQEGKSIVGAREVGCAEAPSRARQLVEAGDILVSTVRPNLNGVARVPDELDGATASTGFCVVRPKPESLDGSYLFHWVKSAEFINDMVRKATGASYPAVSDRIVLASTIPLPSLAEQRRIAAILDQADALRAKRREALALLDELQRGIFIEMFGDLFLNTNGYPVSRLGNLCDVRDGTHDSPKFLSEGYPLVTTKNLRNGLIDFSDVSLISEEDYLAINKRSKVDKGDILMPMIGTIGNPIRVDVNPEFAIKNVALIKFIELSPDPQFILQFLKSDCFDRLVVKKNKGGTQKFLALGEIRELPVPVPPKAVQEKFAALTAELRIHGQKLQASLETLDALFASLQYRAFQGAL